MNELPQSIAALCQYPQFILVGDDKIPKNVNFESVNAHDPANWMDADTAIATANTLGLKVGFVFTKDDPFFFLDIDHCSQDGQWTPIAEQMLSVFAGCAVEVSQSGKGLHIFGTGKCPLHGKKNADYGIEFYTEGRFALLTGNEAQGNAQTVSQHLPWLVENYFPIVEYEVAEWTDQPVPDWNGPTDDDVLIAEMCKQLRFGNRASPKDLWDNNEQALAAAYCSLNDNDPYDRSSADAALAMHLAFWTGKNHTRIWYLMFRSALRRPKWESHKSYMQRTITNAVNRCQSFCGQKDMNNHLPETQLADDPLAWAKDYEISEAEAEQISDPEWIYDNLVIRGHLSVFPAKPNAGKTTIFFHLAGEMVLRGYDVFYVNADISGADAKYLFYKANEMRVRLLLPDMKVGKSMGDIVDKLAELNETNNSLENVVFIFDTLKKMTDVISKQQSKKLYKLLRALTAKGATIILLAHTNKYEDEEGNPIFEGTGDLRADVDELIYLVPMKNADGSLTVSTKPDKVRGEFKPITFDISPERAVTLRDQYVDTQSCDQLARQIKTDQELIELINCAIDAGCSNQKSIVDLVKMSSSYGVRPIRRVMSSYSKRLNNDYDIVTNAGSGSFWGIEQGDRNEHIYKKLTIVPEGEDERSYIAPIAFGCNVDESSARELSH